MTNCKEYQARDILSLGPRFRITANDIFPGMDGTSVFSIYSVTKDNNINLMGMNESGKFKIMNDKSIEIIAGNKSQEKGVDIVIAGMNGDVTITAMSNGSIRIKGKNIQIEAIEDLDLKAGRNINLNSANGRVLLKGNKADVVALSGNLSQNSFTERCFAKSPIGAQAIKDAYLATPVLIGK